MSLAQSLRSSIATSSLLAERVTRSSRIQLAALGLLLALGACTELPTEPRGIDRDMVNAIMPAVTDARLRVTAGISDLATRQKLILGLSDLEIALRQGNAANVRSYVTTITTTLDGYRGQASNTLNPDVSAVTLTLNAVSSIVDQSSY